MIVRGEPTRFYEAGAIRNAPGLGLVRGRQHRHALRGARPPWSAGGHGRRVPGHVGLGIEEDCGLEVSPEGIATVMGHGVVCVVDGHGAEPAPATARPDRALPWPASPLHVLADGDRYDLGTRTVRRG